jgi:hypothetical protein
MSSGRSTTTCAPSARRASRPWGAHAVLDDASRRELMEILRDSLEGGPTRDQEARLKRLLVREWPWYARLPGDRLVDAGLVLVGTWRLADALAAVEG